MKFGVFREKDDAPNDEKLKRVMGSSYSLFLELVALPIGYTQEWKYYGKNFGWQYKVSDSKKALFYLTPSQSSFLVVLGIREKERETLMGSRLPGKIKAEVESAKKHPEGYAARFAVSDASSLDRVRMTLIALIEMRSPHPRSSGR